MRERLVPVLLVCGLLALVVLRFGVVGQHVPSEQNGEDAPTARVALPPPAQAADYSSAILGDGWIDESVGRHSFGADIGDLLLNHRFAELDQLAQALREHPSEQFTGTPGYQAFLDAFSYQGDRGAENEPLLSAAIYQWQLERPRSTDAVLAATAYYLAFNPDMFAAQGAKAPPFVKALEEATRALPDSPYPYVLQLRMAVPRKAPRAEAEAALAAALKRDADCLAAYDAMFGYLAASGEKAPALKAYLERVLAETKARQGAGFYALLAWRNRRQLSLFTPDGVPWSTVRQGFLDYGKGHPKAVGALSAFALLAKAAGDDAMGRALFERMGDDWDDDAFETGLDRFQNLRKSFTDPTPRVAPGDIPYHPDVVARPPLDKQWLSSARQARAFEFQVSMLALTGRYEGVEEVARRLRKTPRFLIKGTGSLNGLYEAMTIDPEWSDKRCAETIDLFRRWVRDRPASATARIALAHALIRWGWMARGGGYADSVTDEGWRLFRERLGEAAGLLEASLKIEGDPEAYCNLLVIAMGLSWPRERARATFSAAVAAFPDDIGIYVAYAAGLLPRWGAERGEVEAFAATSAEATRQELGDGLYAALALSVFPAEGRKFFVNTDFDWARVKRGTRDMIARHRISAKSLTWAALAAWTHNDAKARLEFLRAIPPRDLLDFAKTPYAATSAFEMIEKGYYKKARDEAGLELVEDGPFSARTVLYGRLDVSAGAPRLLEQTDRVSIGKGVAIGLLVKLNRTSRERHVVTYTLHHPPFGKKRDRRADAPASGGLAAQTSQGVSGTVVDQAATSTRETWTDEPRDFYNPWLALVWEFHPSMPEEWVPGTYVLRIALDGKTIAEKKTTVTR